MNIAFCKSRSLAVVFLFAGLWAVLESCPAVGQEELSPAPVQESQPKVVLEQPVFAPPGRFWVRSDYLVWWTSGMHLPPLVTTSPQGTSFSQAGVLPDATVLFGDQTVNAGGRSGFRTTLGMWLDAAQTWDLEFDYFSLLDQKTRFDQSSTGDPILARPLYNVQIGAEGSQVLAFPGRVEGGIQIEAKDHFQSAGALLGYQLLANATDGRGVSAPDAGLLWGNRIDLLGGFRYYNLGDRLSIVDSRRITQAGPTQNTAFLIQDNFHTENDFYGAELGLRTRAYRGPWSFEILTKVALGNTRQTAGIDGQTVITPASGPSQPYNGGVLALGTNSGSYQRDDFTMIPQLGLELGYQVTRRLRTYVGYNLIYWGNVWRSGDQIDLNVDPRNIPPTTPGGLPFPAFPGSTSVFWAQGITTGAEFRF